MKTPITQQLQRVTASFASSEQLLSTEQGQEAICLLRNIKAVLQQIALATDDPFMEAPIVPWHPSRGQRPVLFMEGMHAQAREQTETLLLMCLAYTPVSRSQDHAHPQQRRAITAAMRRLAQTLESFRQWS